MLLVQAFLDKFDPQQADPESYRKLFSQIDGKLHDIESLDHDLIYKRMLNLIDATVRTNYFQENRGDTGHISFKMDSRRIDNLPKPSPSFRDLCLCITLRRNTPTRWPGRTRRHPLVGPTRGLSYRGAGFNEGADGERMPSSSLPDPRVDLSPSRLRMCRLAKPTPKFKLATHCISTRCWKSPTIVSAPKLNNLHIRAYTTADPYLVVAADKGTAAFSDVANEIAEQHGFWLDDAFASGGSQGYDHKKMGITARGAWESVKRHFRGLGKNIQKVPFSVVGIGDMSGDVFGNGMLLSPCIQLVAAFNHMHIFIDPNPDIKKSFQERQRMFGLSRSSWADYNKKLISQGGGVFLRKAKRIDLTPQIKQLIDCKEDHLTPNELIVYILKAQVDLLWNGGIGTYIKAASETDARCFGQE